MHLRLAAAAPEAEDRGREDDQREGQAEAEEREEGEPCDHPVAARLQGPPRHPQQRLDDDGQHLDHRDLAEMRVKH